jgi:hypothetical protein
MQRCYSRLLIDNHITDLAPEFMSRFEPTEYVRMVRLAGVDSAMVYACCHNGNCYYPTQVGHRHGNLGGRDFFGETVSGLNRAGITPVAYYTIIHHNDSAKSHPDWRMRDIKGNEHGGRYWYSCLNNPDYLDFVKQQLAEIAAYEVAGFFIDMTFWPMVCRCESCLARYRREFGGEMPETIDWNNPEWVGFQRARERWLAEAAMELTAHLKALNPRLSVTHQFSPVLHGWFLGQSSGIALASDYASGDFYGDKYQHRLGAKIFAAYSQHQPYEFMTSRCVDLHDHTSTKSADELLMHAGTTLANGGAYFFIDAINPDGTLNEKVYQTLGNVSRRLKPFEKLVRKHVPALLADRGLYFSMSSCVNLSMSGTHLRDMREGGNNMSLRRNMVVEEATGTAALLSRLKAPCRAITDLTQDLSGLKSLIINNAAYMSPAEVERLRQYVRDGGTLIATGLTSLYDTGGCTEGDFQLADVFGVSYSGVESAEISYLSVDGELISNSGASPLARAVTAEVLGTVVEPHYPCNDPERYASIHSNPPGLPTEYVGLSINSYGRGKCVYLYSSLLKHQQNSQREFGRVLLERFDPARVLETQNLPVGAEATLLKSTTAASLILALVNYQDELPAIPACDVRISLPLPEGASASSLTKASDGRALEFSESDGRLSFSLERIDELEMIEINL